MRRRELLAAAKDTAGSVDLGLSVKWAEGNIVKNGTEYSIGAPTDQGCYFSWGNVEGHNYGEGYNFSYSTYNSTPGYSLVEDISAESGYDAARVNLGGNWRMPTRAEFEELLDNCTWTWATVDGMNGYRVTSKKSGYTSNSIFIPVSSYCDGINLLNNPPMSRYWSTGSNGIGSAYFLYLSNSEHRMTSQYGYPGYSVRAVQ